MVGVDLVGNLMVKQIKKVVKVDVKVVKKFELKVELEYRELKCEE